MPSDKGLKYVHPRDSVRKTPSSARSSRDRDTEDFGSSKTARPHADRSSDDAATARQHDDYKAEIERLRSEIDRVKRTHQEGAEINETLEAELRVLRANSGSMKAVNEMATLRKDKTRVEREAETARRALDDLKARHDALQKEAKSLRETKQATERLNTELGRKMEALESGSRDKSQLHAEVGSLRARLEAATKDLDKARTKAETHKARSQELERKLATQAPSKGDAEDARQSMVRLRERVADLEHQVSVQKARAATHADSVDKVTACRDLLSTVHKTLELCSAYHKSLPDRGMHEALVESRDHVKRFVQTL